MKCTTEGCTGIIRSGLERASLVYNRSMVCQECELRRCYGSCATEGCDAVVEQEGLCLPCFKDEVMRLGSLDFRKEQAMLGVHSYKLKESL